MQRILEKLTFANVMSMTAVFIALGGSAVAATLAKNSVGARQIKTNAVGASEIKRNAVGTSEIKTNGVRAAEIGANSVGGGDVVDNSLGSNDVVGLNSGDITDNTLTSGDVQDGSLTAGDVAPGQFLGGNVTTQHEIAAAPLADGTSASYDVTCPAGQTAIAGGSRGDATDSEYTITTSSRPLRAGGPPPTDNENFIGWRATVLNPSGAPTGFPASPPDGAILPEVWAICAAS